MRYILILLLYFGLCVSNAHAATVFYDDLTAFNSASTTSLTDFEGIVADNGTSGALTFTIDGNIYSNLSGKQMLICGKNAGCLGGPFDSALMLANFDNGTLRIDLTVGRTAVGGLFGDLNGTGMGTLTVYYNGGSDTQTVNYGDMGAGVLKPNTFFGWTTKDTVFTALEFAIDPANNGQWSAVDNFQYGSLSQVPIPASIWLFGTALVGFVGMARRRKIA
jgi:hypothetical protein